MAEVVGGALLSAFLKVLINRLASPEVLNFFGENNTVAVLLEKLNITLWSANALLNDAEDKQVNDANVKSWVDKLNEVLHQAENVIDEINTEALCRKIEGYHQSWCSSVSTKILAKLIRKNSFSSFDEKSLKQKIERVIDMLKFLLDQKDFIGLKEGVPSKRLERSAAPLIGDPSDVYGRDDDKEAIVKLVLSEHNDVGDKIYVIPIVGMGGVGKTTLARLVYDDRRVNNHFEHKAWVTVSDDFDAQRLAKLVFKELTSKNPIAKELGKLRDELRKELSGKKFLLVLDDVWSENYNNWISWKSFLDMEAYGNKIILTTRNEFVAQMMGSVQSHPLKTISDEDCWQLFQKHVCHKNEPNAYQDLEKFGREIVKKCKGLPLAVMSIAGLLFSVSDPNKWKEILDSDTWNLQEKGNDEILPSLWLSYRYLPSHLKRCFAYCAIFPKDYEYEKERIIMLWMAEGLLQGQNMEQVGEDYLKILISRSLFQRSSKDESTLVMHDLVHDLAMFALGKGLCITLDEGDDLNSITNKTHHLLFRKKFPDSKNFKNLSTGKCLHTFIGLSSEWYSLSDIKLSLLMKKFSWLRVLCLYRSNIEKLPNSIGKLKYLRYLDLSKSRIRRLTDTICILCNLQTLLLCECVYLTHLPSNIDKLINLRHLDISGTKDLMTMPEGICNLKSLQTLTKYVLYDKQSGEGIRELRKLPHSRGMLEISGLENVVYVEDVWEAEFKLKSLITDLKLTWNRENNDSRKQRKVLDALQPHHAKLKTLEIEWYGGKKFSKWVGDYSFSNITKVSLYGCKNCHHLPSLGQLSSLRRLEIKYFNSLETIGSEFYGSSAAIPFRFLEYLSFYSMHEWRCWSWNSDNELRAKTLWHLKTLKLQDCSNLNSPLPHCFPSLKKLEIRGCQNMETLVPTGQLMNIAFPSLESIIIESCPELEYAGLPFPLNLNTLSLSNCGKLLAQRSQWGLKALKDLRIGHADVDMDSFPEEGLLPTTLISLDISNASHLKALNGKGFQHLTSLQRLFMSDCSEIQCLPEGLPASLSLFDVIRCRLLTPRLQRETGEDWHKISHISYIRVDYETLQWGM